MSPFARINRTREITKLKKATAAQNYKGTWRKEKKVGGAGVGFLIKKKKVFMYSSL